MAGKLSYRCLSAAEDGRSTPRRTSPWRATLTHASSPVTRIHCRFLWTARCHTEVNLLSAQCIFCVRWRSNRKLADRRTVQILAEPRGDSLPGKCDRAILALLIGCGLRCAERAGRGMEDSPVREEHWVMIGKESRPAQLPFRCGRRVLPISGPKQQDKSSGNVSASGKTSTAERRRPHTESHPAHRRSGC